MNASAIRKARGANRAIVGFGLVVGLSLGFGQACAAGQSQGGVLLAVDQNRAAIVDRIVEERGAALVQSAPGISVQNLRDMLMQLRADQLLAASMAGTIDGLRDVVARSLAGTEPVNPALLQPVSSATQDSMPTKAFGDTTDDVVYTPVTPCRLVETRGSFPAVYQGNGTPAHTANPFAANEVRTYTVQGGNGVCTSQLPSSLGAAAVQLQVFGMPTTSASGDIEILPQGSTFGSTATEVFVGSIAFNTVSTTAKINIASNQISVQVRGGKANLAMDVVGYFKVPGNFDASNTVNGVQAALGGGGGNTASGTWSTIGGGGYNTASGTESTVAGGYHNTASGTDSVVIGGESNIASGDDSIAAGAYADADQHDCAVLELWGSGVPMNCAGVSEILRIGATHGLSLDYYSEHDNGYGARWVAIGDLFANQTIATWTGGYLSDGGTWINNSDRDSKVQVANVDSSAVLAKVGSLPISTWRYKAETGQIHMGPMAQDFRAAFGLGADEKHIATIDEDGVALAAIQALYLEEAKRNEADRQKDELIKSLELRLEALESQRRLTTTDR